MVKSFSYRSVRAAYVAAVEKVWKKFPSGNPILKSVRILNPLHRTDVTEREGKYLKYKMFFTRCLNWVSIFEKPLMDLVFFSSESCWEFLERCHWWTTGGNTRWLEIVSDQQLTTSIYSCWHQSGWMVGQTTLNKRHCWPADIQVPWRPDKDPTDSTLQPGTCGKSLQHGWQNRHQIQTNPE